MGTNPYDAEERRRHERQLREQEEKRDREREYARRQANAKETIPATGKHHRKDGK